MEQSLIEEIRQANNIVDVISSYIPIKKSGASFKALCPFHDDKHPSMMISPQKQIFKCFVCGKGGNVFTFVQEYEKITFMEAVRKLAERVGITIKETKQAKVVRTRNQLLLEVYDSTKEYFKNNLHKFGDSVLEYLVNRGIDKDVITNFDIGYSLNSFTGLKSYLLKQHFGTDILKESGLFGFNQNGAFDLFRERLMFPIHSASGKVVAFGGRKLSDDQPGGKYINSPTTPLYTKGRELYGFFLTKFEINKLDYAIVCEGYMDFLRLYSSGYKNCVASLGTALTEDQLKLLKQFSTRIYMAYDGDDAGVKAAIRGATIALGAGFKPFIIEMPTGEDPDSFLLKNGNESFKTLIEKALPFVEFYSSTSKIKLDKKGRINDLLQVLNSISDEIAKDLLIKEISDSFKVKESSIRKSLSGKSRRRDEPQQENKSNVVSRFTEEKYALIAALNGNLFEHLLEEVDESYFFVEKYRNIFDFINMNYNDIIGINEPSAILNLTTDPEILSTLSELIYEESPKAPIDKFIIEMKLRRLKEDFEVVSNKIALNPDDTELYKEKEYIRTQIRLLGAQVISKTLH